MACIPMVLFKVKFTRKSKKIMVLHYKNLFNLILIV